MPAANIPVPVSLLDNDFDRHIMGAPSIDHEARVDSEFQGSLEELEHVRQLMSVRLEEEKIKKLQRLHEKEMKLRQQGEWDTPKMEGIQNEIDQIQGTGANKMSVGGENFSDPMSSGMNVQPPQDMMPPEDKMNEEQDFGLRNDGTKKGNGFLGALKRPDGSVSSEISVGVNIDGEEVEIPAIVSTSTQPELDYMLSSELTPEMWDSEMGEQIMQKAVDHAKDRRSQGLSPFKE